MPVETEGRAGYSPPGVHSRVVRHEFPLAPMRGIILVLTVALLGVAVAFFAAGGFTVRPQAALGVGGGLALLSAVVWLFFRPARFVVEPGALTLEYPLRNKRIALDGVTGVQVMTPAEFRARFGWALRVGVGGLFGGFGWLYTGKGWVEMDISRTDGMVLVDFDRRSPLLVTPARPEAFVQAVLAAARR